MEPIPVMFDALVTILQDTRNASNFYKFYIGVYTFVYLKVQETELELNKNI